MASLAAALCGIVFGFGLIVSGMAQPAKVLNFLDLFGRWDPSLAFVMAAALAVSGAGYALAKRRPRPLIAPQWNWPVGGVVDAPLVTGACLFGLGWGLVGLCPGPALVNLATLDPKVIGFVVAMAAGMVGHDAWRASRPTEPAAADS
jgi:uncharacterized membrane protein YedE/YeeE